MPDDMKEIPQARVDSTPIPTFSEASSTVDMTRQRVVVNKEQAHRAVAREASELAKARSVVEAHIQPRQPRPEPKVTAPVHPDLQPVAMGMGFIPGLGEMWGKISEFFENFRRRRSSPAEGAQQVPPDNSAEGAQATDEIRRILLQGAARQRAENADDPLGGNSLFDKWIAFRLRMKNNWWRSFGDAYVRVQKVTNKLGENVYDFKKWNALRKENTIIRRKTHEAQVKAELRTIRDLPSPGRRDLALFILDVREGVRFFGQTPQGLVVDSYEEIFTDPHGGPPTSWFGLDKANGKMRTREATLEACDDALRYVLTGYVDRVGQGMKISATETDPVTGRAGRRKVKPEDTEAMFAFINTLGAVDAVNVTKYFASKKMGWEVRDGHEIMISSKGMTTVPKGVVELNRSPISNIQDGASGSASLKILDWQLGPGHTHQAVQDWLRNVRKVKPVELHFTKGLQFANPNNLRVPESGRQRV